MSLDNLAVAWISLIPAFFLVRSVVESSSRTIRLIRRLRTAAAAATFFGLTLLYGMRDFGDLLTASAWRGVWGGAASAGFLIVINLLLIVRGTPVRNRAWAWQLFWFGPRISRSAVPSGGTQPRRSVGPGGCILGLIALLAFLKILLNRGFSSLERTSVYQTPLDSPERSDALLYVLVLFIPSLILIMLIFNMAVFNQLQADAAHPLLPALAAPWFVVGSILVDKVSPYGGTGYAATPTGMSDLLAVLGLTASVALSMLEYLILRELLGVDLNAGPPPFYLSGRKFSWAPHPGHHLSNNVLTRLVVRIDHP